MVQTVLSIIIWKEKGMGCLMSEAVSNPLLVLTLATSECAGSSYRATASISFPKNFLCSCFPQCGLLMWQVPVWESQCPTTAAFSWC
jgi:hypothetical protein